MRMVSLWPAHIPLSVCMRKAPVWQAAANIMTHVIRHVAVLPPCACANAATRAENPASVFVGPSPSYEHTRIRHDHAAHHERDAWFLPNRWRVRTSQSALPNLEPSQTAHPVHEHALRTRAHGAPQFSHTQEAFSCPSRDDTRTFSLITCLTSCALTVCAMCCR